MCGPSAGSRCPRRRVPASRRCGRRRGSPRRRRGWPRRRPGRRRAACAVVPGLLEPERRHAAHERRRAGGRGRARAATGSAGRAASGRRRGRSRAGARASAPACRPASACSRSSSRRAAPTQSPANQAPIAAGVGLLALVAARRDAAPRGRRRAVARSARIGAHQVQVGDQRVGHRRRLRPRRPARSARSTASGWKRTQAVDGPVVAVDRRRSSLIGLPLASRPQSRRDGRRSSVVDSVDVFSSSPVVGVNRDDVRIAPHTVSRPTLDRPA